MLILRRITSWLLAEYSCEDLGSHAKSLLTRIAKLGYCVSMPTQNVNLTQELETFVKSEVASGHFNNASEVHRAALASMAQRNEERQLKLERLRYEIQKGFDSSAAGRSVEVTGESSLSEMMDGCLDRAMNRLEAENAEPLA